MGCCMSKQGPETSSSAIHLNTNLQLPIDQLSSYEEACKLDPDLQSFDTNLKTRTHQVISTIAAGVDVRALSFDSLKGVIECLLESNQEVVKVILECKEDIWKNKELFKLVEEYFENSLQTLDFYISLGKCLKRARDSQLHIVNALQQFDEETEVGGNQYTKTLDELKNFKAAGDPFTEEFSQNFQSVYEQQIVMLKKLQLREKKLDKKLKNIHVWRKVSSMIFVATFDALLICSVVAAAVAAPPVAATLAAACSRPIGSMGRWIESLWNTYENALKGQKEVITLMSKGAFVTIQDLKSIRVLINRLQIDIESLLHNASFAIQKEAVKVAVEEMKKKLGVFEKNAENLGAQTDTCSRDILNARNEVLQKIINIPAT